MITKKSLSKNKFLLNCYRYAKVFYNSLIYNTFIYRLFYPKNKASIISKNIKYTLIVCHNGGGGTITYLNNKYGQSKDTLILRNTISADKDYLYSIENNEYHKRFYFRPKTINKLSPYIKEIKIVAVESYMSIESLFNWMKSLNVDISYDLHDFHCIWIDAHLCDSKTYLTEDKIRKAQLQYANKLITFDKWHEIWNNFFPSVKSIFAFSDSSKDLFAHYFPDFSDKVKVTPHSLEYIKYNEIKKLPKHFNVGIFGAIQNVDKGCYIVKDFLEYSKNKDFQIYLNGTLRNDCSVYSDNIHYIGPYKTEFLKEIIIEQGLTVAFFPSVWPETFSYLVSELIAAGLPIACFNLGAQAEKVSQYKYGQIIKENTNEAILEALKAAYEKGQKNGK